MGLESRSDMVFFCVRFSYDNLLALACTGNARFDRVLWGLFKNWKAKRILKSWCYIYSYFRIGRAEASNCIKSINVRCVVCVGEVKSTNHLFVLCEISSTI